MAKGFVHTVPTGGFGVTGSKRRSCCGVPMRGRKMRLKRAAGKQDAARPSTSSTTATERSRSATPTAATLSTTPGKGPDLTQENGRGPRKAPPASFHVGCSNLLPLLVVVPVAVTGPGRPVIRAKPPSILLVPHH
jgi:hypothetical protein